MVTSGVISSLVATITALVETEHTRSTVSRSRVQKGGMLMLGLGSAIRQAGISLTQRLIQIAQVNMGGVGIGMPECRAYPNL